MKWMQLVQRCAAATTPAEPQLSRAAVDRLLRTAFTVLADEVIHGRRVLVPGFGVFYPSTRKARVVQNPVTRQPMQINATRGIGFRVSRSLKR